MHEEKKEIFVLSEFFFSCLTLFQFTEIRQNMLDTNFELCTCLQLIQMDPDPPNILITCSFDLDLPIHKNKEIKILYMY